MDDCIYSIFGGTTFLKVKNTAFSFGKIVFSFVTTDDEGKAIKEKSFDCFLDLDEALCLSTQIQFGKIAKLNEAEKAKGEKYPAAVWKSPLGGICEKKVKERELRNDGKAISRFFEIGPALKGVYVFAGKQGAGKTDANGLIIPDGKPEVSVFVPVPSELEMQKFAESIRSAIYAYRTACYTRFYSWEENSKNNTDNKPAQNGKAGNSSSSGKTEQTVAQADTSKPSDKEPVNEKKASIILATYSAVQPTNSNNGDMCMQALTKDNNIIAVIFKKDEIDKIEPKKWKTFEELTLSTGNKFSILYEKITKGEKEYYYFKGFGM